MQGGTQVRSGGVTMFLYDDRVYFLGGLLLDSERLAPPSTKTPNRNTRDQDKQADKVIDDAMERRDNWQSCH